ncbi:TPA: hypothetical protein ACH3X2_011576 [Trebouxia sp. C0005]
MHQRAVGQSQTDPSERSKPHQTLTAALPPHKPPSVPPHQDGLGVPAPQAPPFPYQQPVMRPAFHQEWHQHIQAPPFLHPGQGRGAHAQWQGYPGMGLPPMMGVRPPPPRPPPRLPVAAPPGFPEPTPPGYPGPPQPGPASFGRGRQGRGAPGRGNSQQQSTGQARGRGRGRGAR